MADRDVKFTLSAQDKTAGAFNSAKRNLSSLQGAASQLKGALAGLLGAFGASQLGGAFGRFADYAGELKKIAAATGLSIEEVSRLGFVASQTETDLGTLAKGVARLSRSMFESVNGNKELARLFKALGVTVTDTSGNLRQPVEVLADLATAFTRVEDPAARLTVQQKILGKGALELAPLLAEGGEAIRKFKEQADELGVTLSAETINAVDELSDNMSALKQAATGLVAVKLGPFLADLAKLSTLAVNASGSLGDLAGTKGFAAFERLNRVLLTMTTPLPAIEAGLDAMTKALGGAAGASDEAAEKFGPSNPRGLGKALKDITLGDLLEQSNENAKSKASKAAKDPRIEAEEKVLEEANDKLKELLREREEIKKSFLDLDAEISKPAPGLGAGTVIEPIRAIDAARAAKDPKEAIRLAEEAREQLRALAEAGTVSDTFLKSLAGQAAEVAEKAAGAQEAAAQGQIDAIKANLEELQEAARIEVGFDESGVTENIQKIAALLQAEASKNPIKFATELVAPTGAFDAIPAMAGGGHVRGRGTGTSDSILARLSNGEYVVPADIVRRFGVGFFDRLRNSHLNLEDLVPRFATGGLVDASKLGAAPGGGGTLNLHWPDGAVTAIPNVSATVQSELRRMFSIASLKIGTRR